MNFNLDHCTKAFTFAHFTFAKQASYLANAIGTIGPGAPFPPKILENIASKIEP
jgi:hypothetical protein